MSARTAGFLALGCVGLFLVLFAPDAAPPHSGPPIGQVTRVVQASFVTAAGNGFRTLGWVLASGGFVLAAATWILGGVADFLRGRF